MGMRKLTGITMTMRIIAVMSTPKAKLAITWSIPRTFRSVLLAQDDGGGVLGRIRPCTGAILVLVFALTQGVFWAGVAATFAMIIGTAITVAILATLALGWRRLRSSSAGKAANSGRRCGRFAGSEAQR